MSQYQNTVAFQAPTDFAAEQANVDRQRKMAEMLLAKSQQPGPQGQMIGNTFVAPSWTQSLSQALNGTLGQYKMNKADEKSKDIATRQRQAYADELGKFSELSSGAPERTIAPLAPNDDEGNAMPSAVKPAAGPDRKAALAYALGAQNPALQKYGMDQMMPKTPEWTLGERFNQQTGQPEKFMYNKLDPSQMQPIGGQQAAKGVAVNGQLVNPATGEKIGVEVPKQADAFNPYKDLVGPGGVPNAPVITARQGVARAGASNVSVNTEKGYAGEIAKGLAKADLDTIDAARAAGDRIRNAQSIKSYLDKNPITGTGAEARLSLNKALTTAGLIDGKQVRDTETLGGLLASSTLDAIKTSGLGSGQGFTDKDRAFLERAKSGNLEINAGTLRDLADLNERAGRASIAKGKTVAGRLKDNPTMGTVGQDFNFDEPAPAVTGQPVNNGFSIKRLP